MFIQINNEPQIMPVILFFKEKETKKEKVFRFFINEEWHTLEPIPSDFSDDEIMLKISKQLGSSSFALIEDKDAFINTKKSKEVVIEEGVFKDI